MNESFDETTFDTLVSLINEVADTCVTFDDRLTFTPATSTNFCVVTFTTLHTKRFVEVTLQPCARGASITLSWRDKSGQEQDELVFEGDVNDKTLRARLGQRLAAWYGYVVRNH